MEINIIKRSILLAVSAALVMVIALTPTDAKAAVAKTAGYCLAGNECWTSIGGYGVCGSYFDCTCSGYASACDIK